MQKIELEMQQKLINKLKNFEDRLGQLENQKSLQLSEASKGFSEYQRYDSVERMKQELGLLSSEQDSLIVKNEESNPLRSSIANLSEMEADVAKMLLSMQ